MLTLRKALSLLSILALLFVSCAEDGVEGPAGPVGPEGQIGPVGNDGNDGQDGNDGVANISTRTYTVDTLDWNLGRATKYNPDITASVVTNGLVSVFRSTTPLPSDSNTIWRSVPDGTFIFDFEKDTIGFRTPGFIGAGFFSYFKVVVIPPSEKISGVDHTNWEELNMVYDIQDRGPFQ